jgi:hypothetical protein
LFLGVPNMPSYYLIFWKLTNAELEINLNNLILGYDAVHIQVTIHNTTNNSKNILAIEH